MGLSKKDKARIQYLVLVVVKLASAYFASLTSMSIAAGTTWAAILQPQYTLPALGPTLVTLWAILSRRWSEIAREIED